MFTEDLLEAAADLKIECQDSCLSNDQQSDMLYSWDLIAAVYICCHLLLCNTQKCRCYCELLSCNPVFTTVKPLIYEEQ